MKALARILPALAIVGGCAPAPDLRAPEPASILIGRTRAELVACAGTPNRTVQQSEAELLIYDAVATRRVFGGFTRFGTRKSDEAEVFHCEATFKIQGGRVAGVAFGGTTNRVLTRDEACTAIVSKCR